MTRNNITRAIQDACPRLTQQQCASAARTAEADGMMSWADEFDISLEDVIKRIIMNQGLPTNPVAEDTRQLYGKQRNINDD